MSGTDDGGTARADMLARDTAREKRVLWQGLVSLAAVVVLAIARARWWM